jgi:hypothetical protein
MASSAYLRERIDQLLAAISNIGLKLDKEGSCQMRCANGLICVIEMLPDTQRAFGYVAITRLPNAEAARAALMQEALGLNLQLQREDVLSLVYDKRIDHIILCSQCDALDASIDEFDQWLGNLIQKGEYIRSKLIQSGLQASINRNQEQRRMALIQKQQAKHAGKTPASQVTEKTTERVAEQSLQHAIRSAQVFRI